MEEADNSKKKEPGTWMSFLVFGIAIAIILTGVVILEFDVHIVLLLALILFVLYQLHWDILLMIWLNL